MPGIKIRKNAIVKAARKEPSQFLNCCDCVASNLDEIEALKSMATIAGKKVHQYGRRWAAESVFSATNRI